MILVCNLLSYNLHPSLFYQHSSQQIRHDVNFHGNGRDFYYLIITNIHFYTQKSNFLSISIYLLLNIMDIYTVYKITCLINNKTYIGFTKKTPEKRLKEHLLRSANNKCNNKFYNAILKYGRINFKTEAIFTSFDKTEALAKEIYYINFYNSFKKGYNSNEGGSEGKGCIVSKKTRKLISLHHADVSGDKNPFFNKKHSDDTKIKIANRPYIKGKDHHLFGKPTASSFKEGKDHPRSQPIVINGTTYESLSLAAKALGTYRQKIKELYLN